jgi:hypothetical protein
MVDFEGDYQECRSDIGLTKKKSGKKGETPESGLERKHEIR